MCPRFAQGGAVATALDDAFGVMLMRLRRPAVTAGLEVDYRRPAFIDRHYAVRADCGRSEGRKLWLEACLLDGDTVIAAAHGLFVEVDESHFLQGAAATAVGRPLPW